MAKVDSEQPAPIRGVTNPPELLNIPVDRIDLDTELRRKELDVEFLDRLAASMRRFGQLEPILVRWDEWRNLYVVILGEKRWRAAKLAGIPSLDAFVHEGATDSVDALEIQLLDMAHTETLKPLETARAYKELMDLNGWTVRRVSEELGIEQLSVSSSLRLLELPETTQRRVNQGSLSPEEAVELWEFGFPSDLIEGVGHVVVERLSPDELRIVVRKSEAESHEITEAGRPAEAWVEPWVITITGPIDDKEAFRAAFMEFLDHMKARRVA